jgi:hypothetical protein
MDVSGDLKPAQPLIDQKAETADVLEMVLQSKDRAVSLTAQFHKSENSQKTSIQQLIM